MTLWMTGDADADRLLDDDPFALLVGMLLDQQVTMESAFAGPAKIAARMDGLDVHRIAEADPETFAALCATPPAVHRYPGSMAGRIQAVAAAVVEDYDGDVTRLWTDGDPDGKTVLKRLKALPGFGDQKARIFLALLGKQRGVQPAGWAEAAGAYGEPGARRSIADVTDPDVAERGPGDEAGRQGRREGSASATPLGRRRIASLVPQRVLPALRVRLGAALREHVLGAEPHERPRTRPVVLGDQVTQAADDGERSPLGLALDQLTGGRDLVGDGGLRHDQGPAERVDLPAQVVEHDEPGGADRDVGDALPPGPPGGVGDDDADADAEGGGEPGPQATARTRPGRPAAAARSPRGCSTRRRRPRP